MFLSLPHTQTHIILCKRRGVSIRFLLGLTNAFILTLILADIHTFTAKFHLFLSVSFPTFFAIHRIIQIYYSAIAYITRRPCVLLFTIKGASF